MLGVTCPTGEPSINLKRFITTSTNKVRSWFKIVSSCLPNICITSGVVRKFSGPFGAVSRGTEKSLGHLDPDGLGTDHG